MAIDQAGLRSAGLLYIVCVIASFVILVFPRNLAFICFFGPWPFVIYYCDHYISTARRAYFLKFIAATLILIPCAFFAHTLVIHQLRSFNQIFESAHLSQLYLLALVVYYAAVFFFDYCIRVLLAHYLFRIRPNL